MIPSRILLAASTALAIAHHASEERPITTAALEQLYRLPPRKLEPVVRKLAKTGIISSIRGAKGGYYLPHPEQVSLAQVMDAVVERVGEAYPLAPLGLLIAPAFVEAEGALSASLAGVSIAHLLREAHAQHLSSLKLQGLEYVI